MTKETFLTLVAAYKAGLLSDENIVLMNEASKSNPELQELFEKEMTQELSDDSIFEYVSLALKNAKAHDPEKPQFADVYTVFGLHNETVMLLDTGNNSLTGEDYRVVLISNRDFAAEKGDVVFSDKSFSFQNQVAHFGIVGNVHKDDLDEYRGTIKDEFAGIIRKIDAREKVTLPIGMAYGEGIEEEDMEEYLTWVEFCRYKLDLAAERIFKMVETEEVETVKCENTTPIFSLIEKVFARFENTPKYELAAAAADIAEENTVTIADDDDLYASVSTHRDMLVFRIAPSDASTPLKDIEFTSESGSYLVNEVGFKLEVAVIEIPVSESVVAGMKNGFTIKYSQGTINKVIEVLNG